MWCGTPDRKAAKCRVRADQNWWIVYDLAAEQAAREAAKP